MGMKREFVYVPILEGKKVTGLINGARSPSQQAVKKILDKILPEAYIAEL
jgi:hypothetical protein